MKTNKKLLSLFALLVCFSFSVVMLSCKKNNDPEKVTYNLKTSKFYDAQNKLIYTTYYTYDSQDRLLSIKSVALNNSLAEAEQKVTYNDKGVISEYFSKSFLGTNIWKATNTNANGYPLTATITYDGSVINTWTYTYENNSLKPTKRSSGYGSGFQYDENNVLKTIYDYQTLVNGNPLARNLIFDANKNLKGDRFIASFEYNDVKMPNWFLFHGQSHLVDPQIRAWEADWLSPAYGEKMPLLFSDSQLVKNLPIGVNCPQSWGEQGKEFTMTYEYDDKKRPTKIKRSKYHEYYFCGTVAQLDNVQVLEYAD